MNWMNSGKQGAESISRQLDEPLGSFDLIRLRVHFSMGDKGTRVHVSGTSWTASRTTSCRAVMTCGAPVPTEGHTRLPDFTARDE